MSAGRSQNRIRSVVIWFTIISTLSGFLLLLRYVGRSDVLADAGNTTLAYSQASEPDSNPQHIKSNPSDAAVLYPKIEPNREDAAESKSPGNSLYDLRLSTGAVMDASSVSPAVTQDVQSPARPFGLDIIAPVQMAGSDVSSTDFFDNVLPEILDYIESNVVNRSSVDLISVEADPSNLVLQNPADVRVYFVGEEAAYHNSLGLSFADEPGSMLVFPDASTIYSYYPDQDTLRDYTSEECPLMPGDFVDLGSAEAGSVLDFFIIPRGADEASEVYGIDKVMNEDQTSHAQILGVAGDSMIVIGFEDLKYGGDRDYEDVVIAVDIGEENLQFISDKLGL